VQDGRLDLGRQGASQHVSWRPPEIPDQPERLPHAEHLVDEALLLQFCDRECDPVVAHAPAALCEVDQDAGRQSGHPATGTGDRADHDLPLTDFSAPLVGIVGRQGTVMIFRRSP
jgi:hypothetical protein